jgi:hypothetical protein
LSEEARAKIRTLAAEFPRVWSNPRTASNDRKRMVALLIEDITLLKTEHVTIHVRFRGGQTTTLTSARPKPMALVRKTPTDTIEVLDRLLDTCSDTAAADRLNALGHHNWKGESFTAKRASLVRRTYGLKSRFDRLRARGFLTAREMTRHLGICLEQVYSLGREGVLPRGLYGNEHRCLYAPLNGATLVKGVGGRYRPRRPRLIPAPMSAQETV